MALIVKDYTWKQSEQRVLIKVPLHGISASKVDLFTSPKYLKASYPPNLFEVLLSRPVDISKSECILTDTEIIYDLRKCEIEHWSDLEPNISKKEKHLLKQELVAEEHDRYQKECKEKRENKAALQKIAVREAIKLDTQQREHIAVIKEAEKSNALGDISDWHTTKAPTRKLKKNHKTVNYKSTNEKSWVPPAIRKTSCTEVSFTPRELPTPSRESRLEEENEWLRKQAEARRSVGFVSEDLRAEEKNPMYLKIKGDEFMNKKNYLGAISAYSFGISLSDKYVDLYVGRSEAQYHQGNFNRAIEDCSTALELMKPEVDANFEARAECIARRALCLLKIGLHKEAISELQVAIKMKPNAEDIKKALQEAQSKLENTDSD